MWHASASPLVPPFGTVARRLVLQALAGVGDRRLGEWTETTRRGILHVRRRLSAVEAREVGPLLDVRGTPEEARRLHDLFQDAPDLRALFLSA